MFDGHFRANAEQKLRPVGRATRADRPHEPTTSPRLGVLMAVGAAVAIGAGALRAGLVLLILTALPDVLDGAVAKASGTASPRGAFFDSVADRVTDALLFGGVAWYLSTTHRSGRGPAARRARRVAADLLRAGQGRVARASTPRAASWSGPSGSCSSASACCSATARPGAVGDARAHRVHRRCSAS